MPSPCDPTCRRAHFAPARESAHLPSPRSQPQRTMPRQRSPEVTNRLLRARTPPTPEKELPSKRGQVRSACETSDAWRSPIEVVGVRPGFRAMIGMCAGKRWCAGDPSPAVPYPQGNPEKGQEKPSLGARRDSDSWADVRIAQPYPGRGQFRAETGWAGARTTLAPAARVNRTTMAAPASLLGRSCVGPGWITREITREITRVITRIATPTTRQQPEGGRPAQEAFPAPRCGMLATRFLAR